MKAKLAKIAKDSIMRFFVIFAVFEVFATRRGSERRRTLLNRAYSRDGI